MVYAEIILPLALAETYHYQLDEAMLTDMSAESPLVGRRVVVSFGAKRFYTGLIRRLSRSLPLGLSQKKVKRVDELVDESPIVSEADFLYWEWLAEYYQTDIGQVIREVFPKGLLPESKTVLSLVQGFEGNYQPSPIEYKIVDHLAEQKKGENLLSLKKLVGRGFNKALDSLIAEGLVQTDESVRGTYQKKFKAYLHLSEGIRSEEDINNILEGELKRAKRQQELLLEFLGEVNLDEGDDFKLASERLLERAKFSRGDSSRNSLIRALVDRGVLVEVQRVVSRWDEFNDQRQLNPTYTQTLDSYELPKLSQGVHYLYTGNSQHKEDYLLAHIRAVLNSGGNVLMLRPNNQSSRQQNNFISKALQSIPQPVYLYDSHVGEAKRSELFLKLQQGGEPFFLIGGRSAVLLPLKNLGLIIIDEEQEYLYKQQFAQPYYHSRDVALWLAHQRQCPIILASETPSAESLFNILRSKYQLLDLDPRLKIKPEAKVQLQTIDLADELAKGKLPYGKSISFTLRQQIEKELKAGRRVLLLKNRRGYAPYLICGHCSESIPCRRCDISLSYHQYNRILECHYCGSRQAVPSACPSCGKQSIDFYGKEQPALAFVGYGTERVEEEVKELFPKAKVLRMDSENLQTKRQQEEVQRLLDEGSVDIIVGTQLMKGQELWTDEDKPLGLIAVLHLDELITYPDFRTRERAYQLLYQLLMRYNESLEGLKFEAQGEGFLPRLVLQTKTPSQEFIAQLSSLDYRAFIKQELSDRQILNFPPFCRMTYINLKGFAEADVQATAELLQRELSAVWQDFARVSSVQRPSVARIDGQYLRQVICRRPFREGYKQERAVFTEVVRRIRENYPMSRRVRILFNVDPL